MSKLFWLLKMTTVWFLVVLGIIKVLEIILEGAIT